MLVRVASDLHLEFFPNASLSELETFFLSPDDRDTDAVLALAGDISSDPVQLVKFLQQVERRFRHVIYVPGNHEYYGHQFAEWNSNAKRWSTSLKRTSVAPDRIGVEDLDGVRLIFCTLWADAGTTKTERKQVGSYMMDFKAIQMGLYKMSPDDMAALNQKHRDSLHDALSRSDGPVVVVTHHLPSHQLCHERFGTAANGGFASSCDHLMEGARAPVLWVHGHTHDTIDRQIGRTRVVCHPAGYRPEWGTPFNLFHIGPRFVEVESRNSPA